METLTLDVEERGEYSELVLATLELTLEDAKRLPEEIERKVAEYT